MNRIVVNRAEQCLVDPQTGDVMIEDGDRTWVIAFRDLGAAHGFVDNALDAMVCVSDRERHEART